MLIRLFNWAREGHSSVIEALLSLGIVGATMAILNWIAIGHRAFSHQASPQVASAVEAAIFATSSSSASSKRSWLSRDSRTP
jgi:hypothetical protein